MIRLETQGQLRLKGDLRERWRLLPRVSSEPTASQVSIAPFAVRQHFLARDSQLDHMCDQAMLVLQQLHHFGWGRERLHCRPSPLIA
jgi:hypothetical protein